MFARSFQTNFKVTFPLILMPYLSLIGIAFPVASQCSSPLCNRKERKLKQNYSFPFNLVPIFNGWSQAQKQNFSDRL